MRHRPKGEGMGAGRRRYADNTAFALSPKGLALTQWGPQAPLQQRKFSRSAVRPVLCARDRHPKGEDAPPRSSPEGRLREAANYIRPAE